MFKRKGILFIPVNFIGWLIFAAAVVYAIYDGVELNNRAHSVSDFLINLVFSLLIIAAVYSSIAYLTLIKRS
jgi:phosphate/sulfate permease